MRWRRPWRSPPCSSRRPSRRRPLASLHWRRRQSPRRLCRAPRLRRQRPAAGRRDRGHGRRVVAASPGGRGLARRAGRTSRAYAGAEACRRRGRDSRTRRGRAAGDLGSPGGRRPRVRSEYGRGECSRKAGSASDGDAAGVVQFRVCCRRIRAACGIYGRHGAAARAAGSHPAGLVRGFASVAEGDGCASCLGYRVPDRRQ